MSRVLASKAEEERALIAERIEAIDVDVLAVQEVEDVETLRAFSAAELDGRYPWRS